LIYGTVSLLSTLPMTRAHQGRPTRDVGRTLGDFAKIEAFAVGDFGDDGIRGRNDGVAGH